MLYAPESQLEMLDAFAGTGALVNEIGEILRTLARRDPGSR